MTDVTRIIKGNWQLSTDHLHHGDADHNGATEHLHAYFDAGIRRFDVADIYGDAELIIGQFLRECQEQNKHGSEDIVIQTKYVPNRNSLSSLTVQDIEMAIDRSLERLGQEQLDLVQLHWWNYEAQGMLDALRTLAKEKERGRLKSIGVTNMNTIVMQEILDNHMPIESIQTQYSILDTRPQNGMIQLCQERGVRIYAYGVLAGGFLQEKWLEQEEPTFNREGNRSLTKYHHIIDEVGGWTAFQKALYELHEVAQSEGVCISTLSAAWAMKENGIHSIIIGARNAKHIPELNQLINYEIPDRVISDIKSIRERHLKKLLEDTYQLERYSDKHAGIMKYELH